MAMQLSNLIMGIIIANCEYLAPLLDCHLHEIRVGLWHELLPGIGSVAISLCFPDYTVCHSLCYDPVPP